MENNSQKIKDELEKKNTLARIKANRKIGKVFSDAELKFLHEERRCVDCLYPIEERSSYTTDTENSITALRHSDCTERTEAKV